MGPNLGISADIKRFFKGVYNLRPSAPKYATTWDPDIVISFLENWKNETISLRQITLKLTTLLALITGHRVQTLAAIEINNIKEDSEGIQIYIPARLKTSRGAAAQPVLQLPFFKDKPDVCAAQVLLTYLERTREIRVPPCRTLLISFKKTSSSSFFSDFEQMDKSHITREWHRYVDLHSALDQTCLHISGA